MASERVLFTAVVPGYSVDTLSEALKTWQATSVSHYHPILLRYRCLWALFSVWFVDTNTCFLFTTRSKDATVILTSRGPHRFFITVATATSQSCFSFQYQIAHLLSSKQRKHNLWLKIKQRYLFLSYYRVPRERMLFCCLAGVFCSRFGGMSLFIVNFWCFIWYAVLPVTCTKVFISVNDCLWSPDLRFT